MAWLRRCALVLPAYGISFMHATVRDRSVAHFLPDFGAETVVALLSTRHAIEYVLIRSTSRASADRMYLGIRFIRCLSNRIRIRRNVCEATAQRQRLEGCVLLPQEV